jgi:hypothetical protein
LGGGFLLGTASELDSAEKCFDWAQHERKIFNDLNRSFVRPQGSRRMNVGFFSRIEINRKKATVYFKRLLRVKNYSPVPRESLLLKSSFKISGKEWCFGG